MTTTAKLSSSHPDVKSAKAKYLAAQKALGKDLGGSSLVDLLADNFTKWPLTKCKEIAALIKEENQSSKWKLLKEVAAEDDGKEEAATPEDEETIEDDGPQDVGSVAERQGFKKTKKEMFAFGRTRPTTLLTKDAPLGGLDITYQYVINPKTGAWILRACMKGQTEADMVQFAQGDDPTSLVKNLKKKNKITAHQAVEFLNPPADKVSESVETTKNFVVIGNAGAQRGQNLYPSTAEPKLYTKAEADKIAKGLNDKPFGATTPGYSTHYHVKALDKAHEYATGNALSSIRKLQKSANMNEAVADKVYTIISVRHRDGRELKQTGTLEQLIKAFSYTLEVGKSWEHEKGRKKINTEPKNIKSLIDNINNAANNAAANGHADRYYKLGETETVSEAVSEAPTVEQLKKEVPASSSAIHWQVSQYEGKITVDWDLTFRRNTRAGAYKENKSRIDAANAVIERLASKYADYVDRKSIQTLEKAKESDEWRESNGDSAYSEYEQSLGGEVRFKAQVKESVESDEADDIRNRIQDINRQIATAQLEGNQANELRGERYRLRERLKKVENITEAKAPITISKNLRNALLDVWNAVGHDLLAALGEDADNFSIIETVASTDMVKQHGNKEAAEELKELFDTYGVQKVHKFLDKSLRLN